MMTEPANAPADEQPSAVDLFFETGLVGMPDFRHFRLEPFEETFLSLTCEEEPALEFVAVPADAIRSGMSAALAASGLVGDEEKLIVLLAVHGEPAAITANLAGPIALSLETGTGRQLVLEGDEYPLRAPLIAGAG